MAANWKGGRRELPHVAIMRRFVAWFLAAALAACSHGQQASQSQSATQTAASAPAPAPSQTPAYTDLQGISAAPYIDELTQLQVFWPPGGLFEPNKPVLRREFARWLLHADDAIWSQPPGKSIRQSNADAVPYYTDVPAQDPDFTAIQGLHEAGVVLAPGRTFSPNATITREQALAIKAYVDCGAPDPLLANDASQAYFELPWRDKMQIPSGDVAAIASCMLQDAGTVAANRLDTVERTFGNVTTLDPNRPLTRAEAAAMIWRIGQQKPDLSNFPPLSAADAIQARS